MGVSAIAVVVFVFVAVDGMLDVFIVPIPTSVVVVSSTTAKKAKRSKFFIWCIVYIRKGGCVVSEEWKGTTTRM